MRKEGKKERKKERKIGKKGRRSRRRRRGRARSEHWKQTEEFNSSNLAGFVVQRAESDDDGDARRAASTRNRARRDQRAAEGLFV